MLHSNGLCLALSPAARKEFKKKFVQILEVEKQLDQAKKQLAVCEERERKLQKELVKGPKDVAAVQERLKQVGRRRKGGRQGVAMSLHGMATHITAAESYPFPLSPTFPPSAGDRPVMPRHWQMWRWRGRGGRQRR